MPDQWYELPDGPPFQWGTTDLTDAEHGEQVRARIANADLARLLARVEAVEQQRDEWRDTARKDWVDEVSARTMTLADERDDWRERAEAAEAKVARAQALLPDWSNSIAEDEAWLNGPRVSKSEAQSLPGIISAMRLLAGQLTTALADREADRG